MGFDEPALLSGQCSLCKLAEMLEVLARRVRELLELLALIHEVQYALQKENGALGVCLLIFQLNESGESSTRHATLQEPIEVAGDPLEDLVPRRQYY